MSLITTAWIIFGLAAAGACLLRYQWRRGVSRPLSLLREQLSRCGENTPPKPVDVSGIRDVRGVLLEYNKACEMLCRAYVVEGIHVRKEPMPPELGQTIQRELRLACDHVESIRLLLQVAAMHHQTIPPAVMNNLAFLGRHLRSLEQQVAEEVQYANSAVV